MKRFSLIKSPCFQQDFVSNVIAQKTYIGATMVMRTVMPSPENARKVLEDLLKVCNDRTTRLIEVERVNEYAVLICIPGGKSDCDFIVWRYSPVLSPNLKIPTHTMI